MKVSLALALLLLGCHREPAATLTDDVKPEAMAVASTAPTDRPCYVTSDRQDLVRIEYERGGRDFSVLPPTNCVVLDDGPSRTLVRLTDGPYAGAVGWVQSANIAKGRAGRQ